MWNCLKTGDIPKLAFFSKPLTNEINTEKNKEVKFTVLDAAVIQILRRRQIQTEVRLKFLAHNSRSAAAAVKNRNVRCQKSKWTFTKMTMYFSVRYSGACVSFAGE